MNHTRLSNVRFASCQLFHVKAGLEVRLTEVGDRHDVHNTELLICSVTFHLQAKLMPSPRMSTVAANHILGLDCLNIVVLTYQSLAWLYASQRESKLTEWIYRERCLLGRNPPQVNGNSIRS